MKAGLRMQRVHTIALLCALSIGVPALLHAQGAPDVAEIDVARIRQELAQMKLREESSADLAAQHEQLLSAEQNLLKALRDEQGAGSASRPEVDLVAIRERAHQRASAQAVAAAQPRELPGDYVDAFASGSHGRTAQPAKAGTPQKSTTQASSSQARELASLRAKLVALEREKASLSRELEEARNRLLIAETEVERLSTVLESRSRQEIARLTGGAPTAAIQAQPAKAQKVATSARASYTRSSSTTGTGSDMPIATVTVDKANLRIGPSLNDSPLMSVSKGVRLAVETRKGNWYRVVAPTGVRAWISSDVVAFGSDPLSSPNSVVRVGGYDAGGAK